MCDDVDGPIPPNRKVSVSASRIPFRLPRRLPKNEETHMSFRPLAPRAWGDVP